MEKKSHRFKHVITHVIALGFTRNPTGVATENRFFSVARPPQFFDTFLFRVQHQKNPTQVPLHILT